MNVGDWDELRVAVPLGVPDRLVLCVTEGVLAIEAVGEGVPDCVGLGAWVCEAEGVPL